MAEDLFETTTENGVEVLSLRVHTDTGAGRAEVIGQGHGALRVRLAMPARADRANSSCIELIAELFSLPKENVTVESGMQAREKRLKVRGIGADDARKALDRAIAQTTERRGAHR